MTKGKALLTGATGFVGREIARALAASGWAVTAAARHASDGPWSEFVRLDITTDPNTWPIGPVDVVVHAAGLAHDIHNSSATVADHERVNALGASHAAEAARIVGAGHFVLVSSVKAMADDSALPLAESDACRPTTPYGMAKLRGERLALDILRGSSSSAAVVRLTPVYGKGSKGNLARLVGIARRPWTPLLPQDIGRRSMIHVTDAASLIVAAVGAGAPGVFIGEDRVVYTPREVQERVRSALSVRSNRVTVPSAALRLAARAGGHAAVVPIARRLAIDLSRVINSSVFDGSVGQTRLGWAPEHTLWSELSEILRA